jgi:VIT1/CCC1 family predicted Fe2+/Mn2+ transporter
VDSPTPQRGLVRGFVVDMNEGIVATAGVIEGFLGAGADTETVVVAALAATVAGSISLAGARYAESTYEHDAEELLIEEHQRQLARSPAEELVELAAHYREQGLSRELAQQVAEQLSGRDALAAHVDAEHGIDLRETRSRPIVTAARTGVASAIGSVVVLLTAILTPSDWRVPSSFLAVALSLGLTSVVLARWGQVPVGRTVIRTVLIGMIAMLVTFAIGSWFDL